MYELFDQSEDSKQCKVYQALTNQKAVTNFKLCDWLNKSDTVAKYSHTVELSSLIAEKWGCHLDCIRLSVQEVETLLVYFSLNKCL